MALGAVLSNRPGAMAEIGQVARDTEEEDEDSPGLRPGKGVFSLATDAKPGEDAAQDQHGGEYRQ